MKSVRDIVRNDVFFGKEKITVLQNSVKHAGLHLPVKAEPLPPVRIDDIRVVCSMAVTAAAHVLQVATIELAVGTAKVLVEDLIVHATES